jgi:putative membrane-bound dehydrogenase-like protein
MRRLSRAALVLLLLPALPRAGAQVPAPRAESTFKTSPGLQMKLWASEPLFVNPTCMDVDHKGRVWVCESVNYRNRLRGFRKLTRPAGDRIVILEDSKGAGKADKATTFYQSPELLAPLGIAVAKDPVGPGYKVFVCQSPDILVFTDSKGAGKADGPPKKLLTNFGGFDHDHGVHGILIGPDMKLYFSVGDTGVHGLQGSDKKGRVWRSNGTDCRAGTIWRCELDGAKLEQVAHNFRNEYEPCVDSFGTVFVSDNDDDGNQQTRICYVMPGGDYGYHPRGRGQTHWHEEQPGVVPKILRTYFGSPTGMCVYEGKLLPKRYQGQLLHTDAGPRQVRCYRLTPDGAGYAVEREDMVNSTDNWFRPSDVCVAPDGSVYVADWYDPGVGGHGMGDIQHGRIYRLAPVGSKPSVPKVDLSLPKGEVNPNNIGVIEALGSPNRAVRYMAMAKLQSLWEKNKQQKVQIITALSLASGMTRDNPVRAARALWQLGRLMGPGCKGVLSVAYNDPDPRFRILALRIAKDFGGLTPDKLKVEPGWWVRPDKQNPKAEPGWKEKVIADPSAAVRREALLLLRDADPASAKSMILALAKRYDGKDRFYLAAVGIAVGHHDPKRREILLADFDKHFPEWDDRTAGLVWELRPPKVLPLLEKRLLDAKVPAAQRGKIVDILATSNDREAGAAVLKLLQADAPAELRDRAVHNLKLFLPGKWQHLKNSPDLTRTLAALLAQPEQRTTGLALAALAGRTDQVKTVLGLARSGAETDAVRRAAVAALGQLPSEEAVAGLAGLLASGPAGLQAEAARALGEHARQRGRNTTAGKALGVLEGVVQDARRPLLLREAAVMGLSGSRPGATWLLGLHKRGGLSEDLAGVTGRLLRGSPYPDLQNKALVAFPPAGRLNPKKLPPLPVLAARKGDAARGKRLLDGSLRGNLQCLKCHTVRGVGGQVGPDLSMIGKKASRQNLFESILYPSKAIADQYVVWQVDTLRGQALAGLLVEETPEALVLRDAEGRDTRVAKKDVETRTKSPKSIMPEDLVVQLSEDDLVDLVEYLFTLKTPALAVDAWDIVGPFDNGGGMRGLETVFAPEKGIDLRARYAGKHGTVRWRKVKPGPDGYVDLQAFYAPHSNQIVSYVTREVVSPADQEATVLLGSDDGAKLWVNGKLAHTASQTRAAAPGQDTVKVRLKKGANRILLKINNGDGAHGFYLTVLTEQELKLAGKKP